MAGYEELLDKAKDELPDEIIEKSRFDMPKVRGHVEGNKTIISNFINIADTLGRNPKHLLKYILGEIGAPGEIVENRVIIGAKTSSSKLNDMIADYADRYVFCKECGKPDTTLKKDGDVFVIKCQACGARQSAYAK